MKIPIHVKPENPVHRDIHSYAVDRVFARPEGFDPEELRSLAKDIVRAIAAACETAGAKDVSHVKAFIEHALGFLHASAVSGNDEIRVAGSDGAAKQFRLVVNVVIFGLNEETIRTATEQALEVVRVKYGLSEEQEKPTGR